MDPKKDLFLFSMYNRYKDQLITVMKDTDTCEKTFNVIDRPKIPIYFTKEKQKIYREYVNKDEVTEHMVSYKWREFEIARMTGNTDFAESVKSGLTRAENIHLNPNLYASDLDIRDYMIYRYMDSFPYTVDPKTNYKNYDAVPPIKNIHIGYLDIETNIAVSSEREKQPIYMITYIDARHNVCYTYYVYNKDFKGIDMLEKQRDIVKKRLIDGLYEDIENSTISDPQRKELTQKIMRDRLDKMQFFTKRYDDEKAFLIDMWQLIIRKYQPDFLLIYNAEYDISQSIMRAEHFGIKLSDLFCIPEMEPFIKFDMPQGKFSPSEKRHDYTASSLTKIIDSMILYFTRRKTSNFSKYSLDSVATNELGIRKLGYGHICSHIGELPYEDFVTTYLYNVRDVILMVFLEDVLNDVKYLMSTRFLNRTEYDRVFIPMIAVTNSFWHIASSRYNKLYPPTCKNRILSRIPNDALRLLKEKDPHTYNLCMALKNKPKTPGGYCSDPTKFKGEGKKKLFSFIESDIMTDVFDEDAKSMYPNALSSSYIAMSTLYGMLYRIEEYDLTEDDIAAIMTALEETDWINICSTLFNLPTMKEILSFLGYEYDEPKPKEYPSHTLNYILNRCNTKKYDNLSSILKNLFKPVQTEKDLENEDTIKLRNIFKITNNDVNQQSYFGTLVEYDITDLNGNIVSGLDYIEANDEIKKYEDIIIDGAKKDNDKGGMDNSLLSFIEPKREPLERADRVVEGYSLHPYLSQFHKDNERNIRMNIEGYKIDYSSRLLAFNDSIIKDIANINLASKSEINVLIHNTSPIIIQHKGAQFVEIESYKQNNLLPFFNIGDTRITSKSGIVYTHPFTIKIINDKKIQKINFIPIDIKIDVYNINVPESKDIVESVIRYSIPLDESYNINIRQRAYNIQY